MTRPSLLADARGASRLAIDLTVLVTELVETMHHNIARRPGLLGPATFERTRGVTGLAYASVRAITRLVGACIEGGLAPLSLLPGPSDWRGRERFVAALNGVLGDHLEASRNPLAIAMQFRCDGTRFEPTPAGIADVETRPRDCVVVLVHGLCMSDLDWQRGAHDHGQALARDLDANVIHVRYNSGLHVSTNGRDLAALLERLVACWPIRLRQLVLVGHSMGGLVIRSAFTTGRDAGHAWTKRLRSVVFLGTPHHGAPLERAGHGVDLILGASPYTAALARLGRLRSAGITDLRHGSVHDDGEVGARPDHATRPRRNASLPMHVRCFAIAGSLSRTETRSGRLRGDGLVPIASALGLHADPRKDLGFAPADRWVARGTGHLDLLGSPAVYHQLRLWLTGERQASAAEVVPRRGRSQRRGASPG